MFTRYSPTKRRTDPLAGLNSQQREAASTLDGAMLILAGAGTGKTKTLTARIAHIVLSRRARPYEVLGLTFTSDAAEVMRERLTGLIGSQRAGQVWIGTFHAIGRRLLKERPGIAGLDKGFEVADEAVSRRLVRMAMEEAGLPGFDDRETVRAVAGAIGRMKDEGVTPDEAAIRAWIITHCPDGEVPDDVAAAARIYAAYQDLLRADNLADFGDLLLWLVIIMERDETYRRLVADRFQFIHIDEYQDTSGFQARFVELLARDHRNLCAVGDDSQSMYAWRGAQVENILGFPALWAPCHVVRLEINYRSTPVILACANAGIANNRRRFEKTLRADPARESRGAPVRVVAVEDAEAGADWIADDIRLRQAEEGGGLQFFVLYRANWLSRVVEEALIDAGVEYTLVGDIGFWARLEVKDVLAYLALASDPGDVAAWERIANFPPRGLGDVAMTRIRAEAAGGDLVSAGVRLAERGVLRGMQAAGARALAEIIATWRESGEASQRPAPFADRVQRLLDAAGYEEHWRQSDDPRADDRLGNVAELLAVAGASGSVEALRSRAARAEEAERDDAAVKLLTIHGAKGLETDEAYLASVDEGIIPSAHAVRAEPHDGGRGIEEERNGMYVGMTRPHDRLTILHSTTAPSRFVGELPVGDDRLVRIVEGRSRRQRRGRRPLPVDLAHAREVSRDCGLTLPAAAERDAALLHHWLELNEGSAG